MCPAVWAITGIQNTTCDGTGDGRHVMSDDITGRLDADTETIMHGESWVDEFEFVGYAYLNVSLQRMEDFEKMPTAERGLGAVSGGFISWSDSTCSRPFTTEQEWGVIDKSKARCVGVFYSISGVGTSLSLRTGDCYSGERLNRVMVCFDRTNAAPVSGFWRNKEVLLGPNIQCDKTNWGRNFKSDTDTGNYMIALEKGELWLGCVFAPLFRLGKVQILRILEPNGRSLLVRKCFVVHTFVACQQVEWICGWRTFRESSSPISVGVVV